MLFYALQARMSNLLSEVFTKAFQEWFTPWSVQEKGWSRLETLTLEGMTAAEYEAKFYQLSRLTLSLIPTEAKRVHRFVKILAFSFRSYVLRSSRKGSSF